MQKLIDKLRREHTLLPDELLQLVKTQDKDALEYLRSSAEEQRQEFYGRDIYIRGLIEFTSFCKNDCYYCGLRKSNKNAQRYRLSKEQILDCCKQGYELGFRTFVLQGGEDAFYTDDKITDIVRAIRKSYPDCAITLSIGEKSRESYQKYFDAGADRYLLRHETADSSHYARLHPKELSLSDRKKCLYNLKEIGYQTGCGFMVGSPYQTAENLVSDLLFIKELKPHMVGIGPFISHRDTPFRDMSSGSLELTLKMLAIIRLLLPNVLLPSTTALGTINPRGRELGILWGANVVMPNLSPVSVRKKYMLYDNKICTGDEAAECRFCMQKRMESIGYKVVTDRGDCKEFI
ncbi:MAG: [FeFe] hydrogenase H-cluster radical SAM maturase HydE [Ruminococcus sp.]